MGASVLINVNDRSGRSGTDVNNIISGTWGNHSKINRIAEYLLKLETISSADIDVSISSTALVAASATLTLSSMVATDTITINGIVFTCMASGATGNQFNVGASDTLTAAAAAVAINASVTANVSGVVTAAAASGVITFTASQKGQVGNAISIAVSAHGTIAGSAVTGADSVKRLGGGTGSDGSAASVMTITHG